MAALDPLPMPPELAEPEPGADAWLEQAMAYTVALATEAGVDADSMGAQLAEAPDDGMPERAKRWAIANAGDAEWAMRHVAVADAELATLRAHTIEWAGRIGAWFDNAAKPLLATKGFMGAHLERFALQLREANPKRKTLSLPAGKVGTTYTAPKVEIADDDAVVAWADEVGLADEVVRVKREPKVSLLREHVTIVERAVGITVVDEAGCAVKLADGSLALPEVGAEWRCPQCAESTVVAAVMVDAYQTIAVPTARMDGLPPHGPLPDPVPGTYVAAEKVTAKVQADRP